MALVLLGVKAPNAAGSFTMAFRHIDSRRVEWLFAGLGLESATFVVLGLIYRILLRRAGARLGTGAASLLVFASSGLVGLIPVGTVPASGWLLDQFRRRGIDQCAGLWSVVAANFALAVTALGLLLIGCGAVGVGPVPVLVGSGFALVLGAAGFVRGAHRVPAIERWLAGHGHRGLVFRLLHRFSATCAELAGWRAGVISGTAVLGLSAVSWILQWMTLVAVFELVGFTAPLHALLFAFTASQVLGAVLPLPAGVGVVEGGLVGALALTGMPLGHAIVGVIAFRAVSYWLVTGLATLTLVVLSHHSRNLGGVTGEGDAPSAEGRTVKDAPRRAGRDEEAAPALSGTARARAGGSDEVVRGGGTLAPGGRTVPPGGRTVALARTEL